MLCLFSFFRHGIRRQRATEAGHNNLIYRLKASDITIALEMLRFYLKVFFGMTDKSHTVITLAKEFMNEKSMCLVQKRTENI
jgi:hypothetical protein